MKKSLLSIVSAAALLLLLASSGGEKAVAQSVPFDGTSSAISQGKVWTPDEWRAAWRSKADYPAFKNTFLLSTVKADGTTSDDIALAADAAACTALNTKLLLPPGIIKLTGAASILLDHCNVEGVGVVGGTTSGFSGTTFNITSTAIRPFLAGNNWRLAGVNFYYPSQVGNTIYPATITMETNSNSWVIDSIVAANPYIFINHTAGPMGAGTVQNSLLYAAKIFFKSPGFGDLVRFTNNHFTPGPWLDFCNHTCANAVDAAALVNTIWYAATSLGLGNNYNISASSAYAWRYGIFMENNSLINITNVDMVWDGVGTLIDSSAGGNWQSGNTFTGNAICYIAQYSTPGNHTGNAPCFNLGSTGALTIDNMFITARGSGIVTAGANVAVFNSVLGAIGTVNDGNDYYGILAPTNPSGLVVEVKNTDIAGLPSNVHNYGVGIYGIGASRALISGSGFVNLNRPIELVVGSTTIITDNWSASTTASPSILITGGDTSHVVAYRGNFWDKLPAATLSACGTSPSAVTGTFSGNFTVGTGGGHICTITFPWFPLAGGLSGMACQFALNNTTSVFITGVPVGASNPPAWNLTCGDSTGAPANCSGAVVSYNCPGWN